MPGLFFIFDDAARGTPLASSELMRGRASKAYGPSMKAAQRFLTHNEKGEVDDADHLSRRLADFHWRRVVGARGDAVSQHTIMIVAVIMLGIAVITGATRARNRDRS